MLSLAGVAAAGLAWAVLLFGVAVLGERHADLFRRRAATVYALSLAVYCTSWTFYGTVAQAARWGWSVPPTFIGTIILFALGFPFLQRLAELARAQNSTSIADLIASRFGKSSSLAAWITGVAVLGMVPYIALQLKAVAMSYAMLTARTAEQAESAWQDVALWVAVLMAAFAMLFGTRRASATEHNRGLVLAMGFESLFKLAAMAAVGVYAVFVLNQGPTELIARAQTLPPVMEGGGWLALVLLGALAMFTLPHQFHIGVVELADTRHLRTARWLFPLYLLLIAAPTLPLAWAGQLALGDRVPADLYVLGLPLARESQALALFTFLGGLSAATGMVIMATITLSIMVVNHWLAPWVLRDAVAAAPRDLRGVVLTQRRIAIALIVILAYGYSRALGGSDALGEIGALSFSALAQLAPAVIAAVYAPQLPRRAVQGGLLIGAATWVYLLLLPQLAHGGAIAGFSLDSLGAWAPDRVLGLGGWDRSTRAVLLSLAANVLAMLVLSRHARRDEPPSLSPIRVGDLKALAARFLSELHVRRVFDDRGDDTVMADASLVARVEHELAAVVGAASSRLLIDAARRGGGGELETMAALVGEVTEAARFGQAVLEAALENMSQGISVVDGDLRLVAWNRRYAELFNYPAHLLVVGTPVEELVRYNAEQGLLGPGDREQLVRKRIDYMRARTPYVTERHFADGTVVEIRGNPMPRGGFVATFTDVTAFRRAESALKRVNETLEQRVGERTAESEAARLEAERANRAKSRFLAAVTHDLMQPLNAAHLFTHALSQQLRHAQYREAVEHIDGALVSAETLLAGLLDISRLDAGGMAPRISRFPVRELLSHLASEFRVLASEREIVLRDVASSAWVESDPHLLRRVLQNFLSNAVRYSERGRVLLGCRHRGDTLSIEVWDTGPGIAEADREVIFEEFRRLPSTPGGAGLGLGLAIADRVARLLRHPIELRSVVGRGTVFAVRVPRVPAQANVSGEGERASVPATPMSTVVVVDNDAAVLKGMEALLSGWRCQVLPARDLDEARARVAQGAPDLLILDYHLDAQRTGLDVLAALRADGVETPAIFVTADHSQAVREAVQTAGAHLLQKPLRPLALKSLMSRLLTAKPSARLA